MKMEERVLAILAENNEEILSYTGKNMLEDGVVDSFELIAIVGDLEDEFDITIPAVEIVPGNFNSVEQMEAMVERLQEE